MRRKFQNECELLILLTPPAMCWDYRHISPCLAYVVLRIESRVPCMPGRHSTEWATTQAFFLAVFSTPILSLLLLHWDGLFEQCGWNEISSQCRYLITWQKKWKVSNLNFPMPESWLSHCLDATSSDTRVDSLPHSSACLISSYILSFQEGMVAVNTLDSSSH